MSLILVVLGVAELALAWMLREIVPLGVVLALAGGLMLLLAASFEHLTVADAGNRLVVRFGPLPLFRTSIFYSDIERVEVGKTSLLDGWGIHLSLRGGWVWNLWGRDCVVLHTRRGIRRIGTDDAQGLAAALDAILGDLPES